MPWSKRVSPSRRPSGRRHKHLAYVLGLPAIAEVVGSSPAADTSLEATALQKHLAYLREEQIRLARQIASVETTITALREGGPLMAEKMFDGFDHTQYQDEVEQPGRDGHCAPDE